MTRSAPKAPRTTSATAANDSGRVPRGASVTSPDSLHVVFGSAARSLTAAAHPLRSPLAMRGFPAWSRTSVRPGTAAAAYVAAGSWCGSITRS